MNTIQEISPRSFVADIVNNDYRTAEVFQKYGIEYSNADKRSLAMICRSKHLDFTEIKKELERSMQTIYIPNTLSFEAWSIDFLIDYIINIHHAYLKNALPATKKQVEKFVTSHRMEFPELTELVRAFTDLTDSMLPHLHHEEEIIFPYIRQIIHAYNNSKAPYAGLLVRTLRKPVENVLHHEHESVNRTISHIRRLTNQYTPPPHASPGHAVTFLKLREIDRDLTQHMYLENDILFPRAIELEKKLLGL